VDIRDGLRILINVNKSPITDQLTTVVMRFPIFINVNKPHNTQQWTTAVMGLGIFINKNSRSTIISG
jgi:hypothetical protein